MLKDFKAFILRGNFFDLATGIIIGASFGKIISSLVSDILMPPIGLLVGKVDFSSLFINLGSAQFTNLAEAKKAGAPTINYGIFLNHLIDFTIVCICIFILIKIIERLKASSEAVAPGPACVFCCMPVKPQATKCPHCTSQLQGRAIGL